jgi:hypothetical protein
VYQQNATGQNASNMMPEENMPEEKMPSIFNYKRDNKFKQL